jgi:hypothetical protein
MSDLERLELYKTEWEREKARREDVERKYQQSEQVLVAAQAKAIQLEQLLYETQKRLAASEREVAEGREAYSAVLLKLSVMHKAQEDLMTRMAHERVWRRDYLEPLADEMAALDDALNQAQAPQDWRIRFEIWHGEIIEGLQKLMGGVEDEAVAEQVRRRVLAQWVFLRWLEVHNLFRERT